MNITIIIPVYVKTDQVYINLCCESIRRNSKEKHTVLVGVNPGDREVYEKYKYLEEKGLADKVIVSSDQGQWQMNNILAKEAQTEWIMLMDDDTVLPFNWEEIFEHLESDIVSMNCMEPDRFGRGYAPPFVKCDCGVDPQSFDVAKFEAKAIELREEKMEPGNSYPFLFKKSLWEKIGGWDEQYDPWGSNGDSDNVYQCVLAGATPLRWRGVLAYHISQVSGTFTLPEAEPYLARNRVAFERKWGIVRVGSPDIWYAKLNLPNENLRFKPSWADPKYL